MFISLLSLTQTSIIIFIFVSLGFLYSIYKKRNDIADVMWGIGIFLASFSFVYFSNDFSLLKTIALIIVFFWGLRISTHIGGRLFKKDTEDARYKIWRDSWKYFYLRSYFQVFILQGFLMLVMASIFLLPVVSLNIISVLGIFTSVSALIFEAVADLQLKKFLAERTGGIMKTGLWALSRHPNYFGEVLFWWGIFLIFIPAFLNLKNIEFYYSFLYFLTPLTISFLILKVSGIPMLEKRYEGNLEYELYKKVTPPFFPKL